MEKEVTGLLKGLLGGSPLGNVGITPQVIQKDIVLEISEEQFKTIALQGTDQRAKDSISIELHDKKMIIKIRLF